ncbi:MAG: hypothetical protein KatS3mg061_2413 [Dehalococcoidia bacterium]|nr:MAG: hypothetical protein KatS3mg061_2413 [Dehalococcoidia bacterium]
MSEYAPHDLQQESDVTGQVAQFVSTLHFAQLPGRVVERAILALLDTVGVALAGQRCSPGEQILAYVRRQGGVSESSVLGARFVTSAPWAALANGVLAHALDYDDTTYGMNGHLSSVLMPVVLALGERARARGRDLITAYVAGFELGSRLGRDLNPDHYEAGWHSTATIGHLAAAGAASALLQLNPGQTRMALGIAATAAGGLRANIGSMTKPLHSGLAAQHGVMAAQLAQAGWTATSDGLGARYGFASLFAPGRPLGPAFVDLGTSWDIETVGVAQKLYPSCAATHRAIDALLDLRARAGLRPEMIAEISCGVDYLVPTYLTFPQPRTAEEARFSLEYTLAVAAIDGQVGLRQFEPDRLHDPAVAELARRVRMYVHPEEAGRESWQVRFVDLEVNLQDGRRLHRRVYEQRGHPNNPLSADELAAKYRDTAGRVLSAAAVEESLALLRQLDQLDDLEPLIRLLRGAASV